jgi:tetratricopeptide (TPR) repeat protein
MEMAMKIRRWITPLVVAGILAVTSVHSAQTPKTGGASKDSSDIKLVEDLLVARRDYQRALELLRAHYKAVGDQEKAKWAEDELRDYHRINHQAYRLDLDVPPPTLTASGNVKEANQLLSRAMEFKDKGFGVDYIDNQRRAEILLQQLLTMYPSSSKIGDAGYMLGELYESKAFQQYRRAAIYFERSVQWNPTTQLDGRLRAARIYDKRLPERGKAIELYKEITTHETDPKRKTEAEARLKVLTGGS